MAGAPDANLGAWESIVKGQQQQQRRQSQQAGRRGLPGQLGAASMHNPHFKAAMSRVLSLSAEPPPVADAVAAKSAADGAASQLCAAGTIDEENCASIGFEPRAPCAHTRNDMSATST